MKIKTDGVESWADESRIYRVRCDMCPEAPEPSSKYGESTRWATGHAAENPGHIVGVETTRITFYKAATWTMPKYSRANP